MPYALLIQLGVDLRRCNVLVTEQTLNNGYVHAAVQRVRCEGMAQQMRVYPALQSGAFAQAVDDALNGTRLERLEGRFAAAVFSPLPSSILLRINILRRTTQLYIGAYEPALAECYG